MGLVSCGKQNGAPGPQRGLGHHGAAALCSWNGRRAASAARGWAAALFSLPPWASPSQQCPGMSHAVVQGFV